MKLSRFAAVWVLLVGTASAQTPEPRQERSPEVELIRVRILERVEQRIQQTMERLRVEVRDIIAQELASERGDGVRRVRGAPGVRPEAPALPHEAVGKKAEGRAWLGVELPEEGKEGLVIRGIVPKSPAGQAGLQEGDKILRVDGVKVSDREALRAALGQHAPGDPARVTLQRGGEMLTLIATLGPYPEEDEDEDEGEEANDEDDDDGDDEQGEMEKERPGEVRQAAAKRASAMVKFDFTDMAAAKAPEGWSFARTGAGAPGTWTIEKDGANLVLKQSSTDETDFRFPIAVYDGGEYGDCTLSVRFKAITGKVDQAGGLAFHYRDANNYLLCRANALEDNFRVYTVSAGKRKTLKSQNVKVSANEWHALRVECHGKEFRCQFDDNEPLVVEVEGFGPGKVGVWTKADSVTEFDDFTVAPIGR